MLGKTKRYTKEQFSALLSRKDLVTVYNSLGTLKYHKEDQKLAVVASSKHEKRAVYRNKARRRVYDVFRGTDPYIAGVLYLSKQSYEYTNETTKKLAAELFAKASR